MNILLINHYAGSPIHGMEYRPYYLAKEWIKLGHKVRIIASSEAHLHQTKPFVNDITTLEVIDNIEYLWLRTPAYKGNGIKRIINMFVFLRRLYSEQKEILNDFTPDIVIASSPHPFIFRGSKSIASKTGAKLIYEVRDLWPLSLIELLGIPKYHPLIMLMQHEENNAYQNADKVVSLASKSKKYMSNHGLNEDNFIHIPNGISVDHWNDSVPLSDEHLSKIEQFSSQFDFLIGYSGTHGKPNALTFLIEAFDRIKEHSIGVVLIGSGLEKKMLIQQAKELKLTNVLFLDPVSKAMVPSFLDQMDALYIGWENQPLYRFGISANKLFEYMMSGKPIIHSVEAGNDPVTESDCGYSCLPENIDSIATTILKLKDLPKKDIKTLGKNGKEYVISHHDYSILAKNYLNSIK